MISYKIEDKKRKVSPSRFFLFAFKIIKFEPPRPQFCNHNFIFRFEQTFNLMIFLIV